MSAEVLNAVDALSEFLRRPPEQLTISTSNSTDASWNGSAP
jgi:hypothetical protein